MGSCFCAGMSWHAIMPAGWNAPWLLDWHSDGLLDGWAGTETANLSHTKRERPTHTPAAYTPTCSKSDRAKAPKRLTHQWDSSLICSARSQAEAPLSLLCSWTVSGPPCSDKAPVDGGDWEDGETARLSGRSRDAEPQPSHLLAIEQLGLILKSHAGHRLRSLRPIRSPTVSRHYFPAANMRREGIGKSLYSTFKRKDFCNDVNVIMYQWVAWVV